MKKILSTLLVFGFISLTAPAGVLAQTATLALDPAAGTFNRGCNFSVNVNVDTGGTQTDGTDAILIYDSSRLTATSVTNGTIYPDYPGNNIDAQTGKITIAGLASVTSGFAGKGTLATVNFTVKDSAATGATEVKFDFNPTNKGETRDSNVVERSTIVDVLNSVTNGNYTVGTGACGTGAVILPPGRKPIGGNEEGTPSATPPPVRKKLPDSGTPELTATLAIFGGVLTVLGILGLALL